MIKKLTTRQINGIVNTLSSSYEESLIELSMSLVLKDRNAADYLRDMLTMSLDDSELEEHFGVEE
tara:strand:+ start:1073 stop:1267 length:195 start_codon:yes stop_codon:yes gene_type:complete